MQIDRTGKPKRTVRRTFNAANAAMSGSHADLMLSDYREYCEHLATLHALAYPDEPAPTPQPYSVWAARYELDYQ